MPGRVSEGMKAIGVDLGGTNVRVALGDHVGTILRKAVEPVDMTHGRTGLIQQLLRLIAVVKGRDEITGVGIGALGPLDMNRGMILHTSHFPFHHIALQAPLEQAFNVPVTVINDCAAAVLGEQRYGLGVTIANLVFLTISSGIGCGALVDGTLLLGKDGNASEMGHTIIDMTGSLPCGCGKRGHWEAYCAGSNIPQFVDWWIREQHRQIDFTHSQLGTITNGDVRKVTAQMVYDTASQRDALSVAIVNELGRLNAMGIANVIAAYDPELITLGGSVVLHNQPLMLESIQRYVSQYTVTRSPPIVVTPLGHDVGMKGALARVFSCD